MVAQALAVASLANQVDCAVVFRGGRRGCDVEKLSVIDRIKTYGHVDAVEDWAREFLAVSLDLIGRTLTVVLVGAKKAARARIHGGDEHEVCGITEILSEVVEGDLVRFEWQAKCLDDSRGEFG